MLNDELLRYTVEVALAHLLEPIPDFLLYQLLTLVDGKLCRTIRLGCFVTHSF